MSAAWWKQLLEYLGGECDSPPANLRFPLHSLAWGVWWGLLLCLIMLFSGQASKFIYLDF